MDRPNSHHIDDATLLATSDDPASWFAAGLLFELGSGVPQDRARALKLYEIAARAKVSAAAYRIAYLARDLEVARSYLRIAADAGYPPALFDLWWMSGETDIDLLRQAADRSFPPALHELGERNLEDAGG